jgi:RNA polymerase sigma-70 factor (ECF subfamily)
MNKASAVPLASNESTPLSILDSAGYRHSEEMALTPNGTPIFHLSSFSFAARTCSNSLCHEILSGGVIHIVNAPSEAVADVNATSAPFDIEALFRSHYSRVARIIERVVRDRARSEELAVEVFLKLWRNQKAQHENVEAWLYRVAVRTGIDGLRRQTRRAHYERALASVRPQRSSANPEQLHSANEEQERVRAVLSAMHPRHAQFLLLRSQDFTYDEVAAILNLNPASIGTLLSRAQESFRKEYTKRYGQE